MPEENKPVPANLPSNTNPLDKNVPNPLAKNPNVHTHKVFASVGLILIGTILAIAGIWWYVQGQSGTETEDDSTTKVSTSSAKKATDSVEKDETADWKTFESKTYKYSIKYPNDWLVTSTDEKSFTVKKSQDSMDKVSVFVNMNTGFCEGASSKISEIVNSNNKGTVYTCYTTDVTKPLAINYLFKDLNGNSNYIIAGELPNEQKTVELILATFKFL